MTREIDAATMAASRGDLIRPVIMLELDYPLGVARLCSTQHSMEWGGSTWYGMGALGAISDITEGAESRSYGVTATLSGIPADLAGYLLGQDVQGRTATVRLALLDGGHAVIGEPVTVFVGRMDTQDVSVGETVAVQVSIESLLIDWERARVRRYTDVDQQASYPGDRGFEYVSGLQNLNIKWGK